ncbi:thiamine diphosphokinase [Halobacillus mangrovi]|uniref:Thiamine diphosphokinase n=1 Tax=Halobacillus mangrovi TaxID=402384 RepID=A0A1W5ZW58_9BACI|nr:thiamine diphosphokinase [Halobacillus mangrovi]ARI77525.1 thiamine diphosphokinase [Halobacillus mangrovi]
MSRTVAIIGGGPKTFIPDLTAYDKDGVLWIGADQGAEVLLERELIPDFSIGDFDSVSKASLEKIKEKSAAYEVYPNEKDETDLELAIRKALKWEPQHILLFGVTGGRMDHSLANIQLLYPLMQKNVQAKIIDVQNQVELVSSGVHTIEADEHYPYLSFLPITLEVKKLTLTGFYYPLTEAYLPYGSTLCISNRLIQEAGTFSFESGILLVIRSKDLPNRG